MLALWACKDDVIVITPINPLEGKYQTMTSIISGDTTKLYFFYDTTSGELQKIADHDSSTFLVQINRISNSLLHLVYFESRVFEVMLNGDQVESISHVDPPISYRGTEDWQVYYSEELCVDSIQIQMDYTFGIFPDPGNHYKDGLMSDFEYNQNYESSLYSYQLDGGMVSESFNFTYTPFIQTGVPALFQFPYFSFDFDNWAHFQFSNGLNLATIVRLCGYKIFKDNQNLVSTANDVMYNYTFDDDSRIVEMAFDNIAILNPGEQFIVQFAYH
jgi:hypothetical protein